MKNHVWLITVAWVALCVHSVIADIGVTTAWYSVNVTPAGGLYALRYPAGGVIQLSYSRAAFYHTGGGRFLDSFTALADVGYDGGAVTSLLNNGEVTIAIRSEFHEHYIQQRYTFQNVTSAPLTGVVFYRGQDGDLQGSEDSDVVGYCAPAQMPYQHEGDLWLGLSTYTPYMYLSFYTMGGYYLDVYSAMTNNSVHFSYVQTNDSAITAGILYATVNPGQSYTMFSRTVISTNGLNGLLAYAIPATSTLDDTRLRFVLNFKKPQRDRLKVRTRVVPATPAFTNLAEYVPTLWAGDYLVFAVQTGTVRQNRRSTRGLYVTPDAKVLLKTRHRDLRTIVKARVQNVDLAPLWGIADTGVPGTLDLPLLLYLNTTNAVVFGRVQVPYTNKLGKKAKGKAKP